MAKGKKSNAHKIGKYKLQYGITETNKIRKIEKQKRIEAKAKLKKQKRQAK